MVIGVKGGRLWLVALALVLLMLAGCVGSPQQPSEAAPGTVPTQRPASSPTATPTATPEEEVLTSYLRYWDAYGQAVLELQPELVEGVAAKDELAGVQREILRLRGQNVALRVRVKHNALVLSVDGDSATLYDEMINNSFYVDAATKEPPEAPGSGEVLKDTYYLEKIGDSWIVVRSTRLR